MDTLLNPISHKLSLFARPGVTKKGTTPSETRPARPRDLVEIKGGTTTSALKHGARNAAGFFLKNCLPLVGAAVAGLPGLAAGAVLGGVITAATEPEKKLRTGAMKAVTSAGVAAAASLAGPLAPALQWGATGLGTLLAGGLEVDNRIKHPDFKVDLPKTARRFHQEVAKKLEAEGYPASGLGRAPKAGLLGKVSDREAQIHLAKTALLASHHLGPGVAVALARNVGTEGVNSAALSELTHKASGANSVSSTDDGVEIQYVEGLKKSQRSDGVAVYNTVLMDAEYAGENAGAKGDFVLGHEASHVRHQDSSGTLIQKTVMDAVAATSRWTGDPVEVNLLNELHNNLESARRAESREIELRADQEGIQYALGQGHSRHEVVKAAGELFANEPDTDPEYREHPEREVRLRALEG